MSDRTRWTFDKEAPVTIEESGGAKHVRFVRPPEDQPRTRQAALIEANRRWQNETRTHAIRREWFIEGALWAEASQPIPPGLDVERLTRALHSLRGPDLWLWMQRQEWGYQENRNTSDEFAKAIAAEYARLSLPVSDSPEPER